MFRAVPVLTQLFIIYFGLTEIGIRLDPLPSAIVGFGINGGAYLTEVFRAGIESIHHGQMEAAQMLGMTRLAALRIVILPQAVRVVLPPLGNFAIGLLKDTALASAVAAPELMFQRADAGRQDVPRHADIRDRRGDLSGDEPAAGIPDPPGGGAPVAWPAMRRATE